MIIECINCNKRFEVNPDLIPNEGRNIQCGSCHHIWFFKKNNQINLEKDNTKFIKKEIQSEKNIDSGIDKVDNIIKKKEKSSYKKNKTNQKTKTSALIKYENRSFFSLSKFLSYIIVIIISFIALILILDTFKNPLYNIFPNLEFVLFNLYETIKDIKLFIIDLI
tara:strand:- start:35 stop:529 length:495 start_codon:yes stop_codon:yes gene_type:complete